MRKADCALCGAGADSAKPFIEIDGRGIVKCRSCGLVYLYPRPSEKEIGEYYRKSYFENENDIGVAHPHTQQEIQQGVNRHLGQVDSLKRKPGRLLEIGCGNGLFLKAAQTQGWDVLGVEISKWASEYASERLGIRVLSGKLDEVELEKDYFDVVALFHCLEHHLNPLNTLRRVRELLKSDGMLVIALPNINSIDRICYGKKWRGYRMPFHLYHFSTKTLTKMLNKAGFKVVRREYSVPWAVRQLAQRLINASDISYSTKDLIEDDAEHRLKWWHGLYKATFGEIPIGPHMVFHAEKCSMK